MIARGLPAILSGAVRSYRERMPVGMEAPSAIPRPPTSDIVSFSVIIPSFNKKPHLVRALDSVLAQTWPHWELIVVDDRSDDGSWEVLQEYRDSHPGIPLRILRRDTPGPGGYAARNTGAEVARHAWLAFLDADDLWLADHLSDLSALTVPWPGQCRFLCSSRLDVYGAGRSQPDVYRRSVGDSGPRRMGLEEYLDMSIHNRNPVQTSSVAMSRELYRELGGFPDGARKRGGDRALWLAAMTRTDLGWTSSISAEYHRDAVNMVTKQVPHEYPQASDPILESLMAPGQPRNVRHLARRLWNYERFLTLRKALRSGTFRWKDLAWFHVADDLGRMLPLMLQALVPNGIRKRIYGLRHRTPKESQK